MRTDWFTEARFGMFLHWGLYSLTSCEEWVRSQKEWSVADYQRYYDAFDPTRFDPRAWAKAARKAGMKYMVLTAKHHDGFCLFDSALTDYKATNTRAGRDLVAEFVEAVRAEGLKVGLYYSLLDWHHPDYPQQGDLFHPMRNHPEAWNREADFDRYLDYMHGQVRELCTNYGKLDLLWFDFSYGKLCGEAWRAEALVKMVRALQPGILIDNRLEGGGSGYGSLVTDHPTPFAGDFVSPEQHIPENGIHNSRGELVPWELCTTMNNHWCYMPQDTLYKPVPLLLHKLLECVSKGGNMILNAGPLPTGELNAPTLEILAGLGGWMEKNGESIYGCTLADLPKPDWGRYTRKGNTLYAHVLEAPLGPIGLFGIDPARIESVSRLADGTFLPPQDSFAARNCTGTRFVSLGDNGNYTYPLPEPMDTVLKIQLKA